MTTSPRIAIFFGSSLLALGSCNAADSASADGTGTGTDGGTATLSSSSMTAGTGDDGGPQTATTSMDTTDGSADSTGEPADCRVDADCASADSPFCVDQTCVPCSATADPDARCAEMDPSSPLCVDDVCVQCTDTDASACDEDHPICDTTAHDCLPCTAHDQCPGDAACELFTGRCFPEDDVRWVNSQGLSCSMMDNSGVGDGSEADPWCNVSDHLDDIPVGGFRTFRFVDFGGADDYPENIALDGNRRIALIGGDPAEPPNLYRDVAGPAIHVTSTSGTVYLHQVHVSGSGDPTILLEGSGSLYATSTAIRSGSAVAIDAANGSRLALVNAMVEGSNGFPTVSIDGGEAVIEYSTLVGANADPALQCVFPADVQVRNSIVVTRGGTPPDEINCPNLDITHSATEGAFQGEGNVAIGPFPAVTPEDWFVDLGLGDFHLQNDGLRVFADIGSWQAPDFTGDPPYYVDPPADIDGDPRPATDGAMDYVGADRP